MQIAVAQKPEIQKHWVLYPHYFRKKTKAASSEGRIFLNGEKTTNFEIIAHLNTKFDVPRVKTAHFKTGKK